LPSNVLLAAIFRPLSHRLGEWWITGCPRNPSRTAGSAAHLDPIALATAALAIANAARESIRLPRGQGNGDWTRSHVLRTNDFQLAEALPQA